MKTKLKLVSNKTSNDDDKQLVQKLMKDPVVSEHCQSLDKQGIEYEVIPIRRTSSK